MQRNSIRCAAPRLFLPLLSLFYPIAYSASSSHVSYLNPSYGLALYILYLCCSTILLPTIQSVIDFNHRGLQLCWIDKFLSRPPCRNHTSHHSQQVA
ncbi:hypothetical protein ACQKWADRAFT_301650 [Trichoderma austrokoningii]